MRNLPTLNASYLQNRTNSGKMIDLQWADLDLDDQYPDFHSVEHRTLADAENDEFFLRVWVYKPCGSKNRPLSRMDKVRINEQRWIRDY
ncbi:MAG: hypothetical protein V4568_03635 [Pseudomonadota bacterium]